MQNRLNLVPFWSVPDFAAAFTFSIKLARLHTLKYCRLTANSIYTIILLVRFTRLGVGMTELATTKMSSKGQVVIPEEIRKRLGLEAGAQFVVVADKDTVIMKAISPPSMDEFDTLLAEA